MQHLWVFWSQALLLQFMWQKGLFQPFLKLQNQKGTILNLPGLNVFIQAQKLCMQFTRSLIASLHQGDFLSSVDIKNTYLHVPVSQALQWFLCFAVGPWHTFPFVTLSFSLSSALLVFTKVLAHVLVLLCFQDIPCWIFRWHFLRKHSVQVLTTKQGQFRPLKRLGWILNLHKTALEPTHCWSVWVLC